MRVVISPALFLIHPSENIYWTNYNGLALDFLPVLHMLSLLMNVVLTARQAAERKEGKAPWRETRSRDYIF